MYTRTQAIIFDAYTPYILCTRMLNLYIHATQAPSCEEPGQSKPTLKEGIHPISTPD